MTTMTETTPYEVLDGEAGIKRLVHRFYELMDELPGADGVRQIHPASLADCGQSLLELLSGWMADLMNNPDRSQGCQYGVA